MKTLIIAGSMNPGSSVRLITDYKLSVTKRTYVKEVLLRLLPVIILFILTCTTGLIKAQVPQGFNYQAIARNVSGDPITDQLLPIRITILHGGLIGLR